MRYQNKQSLSIRNRSDKLRNISTKVALNGISDLNRRPLSDLTVKNRANSFNKTFKKRQLESTPMNSSSSLGSPYHNKRIRTSKIPQSNSNSDRIITRIRNKLTPNSQSEEKMLRQRLDDLITTSPALSQFMISSSGIEEISTPTKKKIHSNMTAFTPNNALNELIFEFINNGITPSTIFENETATKFILPPIEKSLGVVIRKKLLLNSSIYLTIFKEYPEVQNNLNAFMNEIRNFVKFESNIIFNKSVIVLIIPAHLKKLQSFQKFHEGIIENNITLNIRTSTGKYQIKPESFQLKDLLLKIQWEDIYFSQIESRKTLIEVPSDRNKPNEFNFKNKISGDNILLLIKTEDFYGEPIAEYLDNHLQFGIL